MGENIITAQGGPDRTLCGARLLPDPGAPIQAAAIGSTVYVGTLLWLPTAEPIH